MNTSYTLRRVGLKALVPMLALALAPACTDLTETPGDALTPNNAFKSDEEILAGVASVYAQLRGTMWGYYNLNEVSTDEAIVPTRGSDWYDNGRWLEIYKQTWTANSGSALDDMNGTWNDLFSGVAKSNLILNVIQTAAGTNPSTSQKQTIAELRTLRAWYYFMLQDFFGGVPLVTTTEVGKNPRKTRQEIFNFIETELTAAVADLPATRSAGEYGRLTKGAANAILAALYINAGVYTKDTGISATSYNSCSAVPNACQKALDAANAVINSGVYSLAANWKTNFAANNESSPENIFVLVESSTPGLGMNFPMRTLHYNQLSPSPWNGFATIAETYNKFKTPGDTRKDMWLVGQQYSFNTGAAVKDRAGNPLIFTESIANENQATEAEGPRFNKFVPTPDVPNGDSFPNDYPFFRLAEMYLIKAEAQNELGQTAAAIDQINIVRTRAGAPALAAGLSKAQVQDAIYTERLLEFAGEGKRRRDMVRFGHYVEARQFKTAQGAHKVIFPVPETQIQANPLLTQNAGY